jgi:hypothetical protein
MRNNEADRIERKKAYQPSILYPLTLSFQNKNKEISKLKLRKFIVIKEIYYLQEIFLKIIHHVERKQDHGIKEFRL